MRFLILLSLTILYSAAFSQEAANHFSTKLENGLQVIVIEEPSLPVVSVAVAVKEGPAYLDDSLKGLNSLSKCMFMDANEKAPSAPSMKGRLGRNYIEYSSDMTETVQLYIMKAYKSHFDSMITIMNDALRYPIYTDQELNDAKHECESAFKHRMSAVTLLNEKRDEAFEQYGLRSLSVQGKYENISRANRERMLSYHSRYYAPANVAVIIYGNVNHANVIAVTRAIMGSWGTGIAAPLKTGDLNIDYSSQSVVASPLAEQPEVQLIYKGPVSYNKTEIYSGLLLSELITDASSPFRTSLSEKNLLIDLNAGLHSEEGNSWFSFGAISYPEKLKDAYSALLKQVNGLVTDNYISEDGLSRAKAKLIHVHEGNEENVSSVLLEIAKCWAVGGENSYYDFIKVINAITLNNLKEFAGRYLVNKKSIRLLTISPYHEATYGTEQYFIRAEWPDDIRIRFGRNDDMIDATNVKEVYAMVQFLKMNPDAGVELQVNQDVLEKKELVKQRYISLYKKLVENGLSEEQIDKMQAGMYIRHGVTTAEQEANQCAILKAIKK